MQNITLKHIATVPARVFRAAQMAQAVRDVRYYLCGVNLNAEHIVATDGHTCFINYVERRGDDYYWLADEHKESGLIIHIDDAVPLWPDTINIYIEEGKEWSGVAVMADHKGQRKFSTMEIIDGKFPDYRRILPSEEKYEEVKKIGFNAGYLSKCEKVLRGVSQDKRWNGVTLNFSGENGSAVATQKHYEFGTSQFIVMPMRV